MFGTISPKRCALPDARRTEYDRFYCGVCQSLGAHHGLLTRGTLSDDAVFMSLLADAILDTGAEPDSCRCPLIPIRIKKTVNPRSVAMRYATAVQMLLGDQWLADRAMDGRAAFRWARRLASGHVARARAALDELGIDAAPLRGVEARQASCEVLGVTGPVEAAAPTENALGFLFAQLANLPGAVEPVKSAEARENLRLLGAAVGRLIYYIDALEDLKKDLERSEFNPCVVRTRAGHLEISAGRAIQCIDIVGRDLVSVPKLLAALPLVRHREVLEHLLCDRLARRARQAIDTGRKLAQELPRALIVWLGGLAWPRRTVYSFAAWMAWIFIWLQLTGSALAEKVTGTNKRTQAKAQKSPSGPSGVATKSTGDPLESGTAANKDQADKQAEAARLAKDYPGNTLLPSRSSSSPGDSSTAKSPENGSGGSNSSSSGSGGSSSSSESSGSSCSNPCSGCGDTCSSCGDSCSSCGDSCKGCGDGCKGCGDGCSSCGDGCKGCDGCCSGCGDCGKCGDCGSCCK